MRPTEEQAARLDELCALRDRGWCYRPEERTYPYYLLLTSRAQYAYPSAEALIEALETPEAPGPASLATPNTTPEAEQARGTKLGEVVRVLTRLRNNIDVESVDSIDDVGAEQAVRIAYRCGAADAYAVAIAIISGGADEIGRAADQLRRSLSTSYAPWIRRDAGQLLDLLSNGD